LRKKPRRPRPPPAETAPPRDAPTPGFLPLVRATRRAAPIAAPEVATPESATPVEPEEPTAPPFDPKVAAAALAEANSHLAVCSNTEVGPVNARANVTFAPSGRVTTATIDALPAMMGTPVAGCVVSHLRTVRIEPFAGDTVTIHTTVSFR